jgi:benzoyl-CoA reductase/2-hydroxyglutaryl-CoA dehydratase subunit BcrC/BadD/HgdB
MPKEKVNWMLDELFAEIEERRIDGNYRARLVIAGGELDEPEYLSNIEEQGGLSVAEDVCFGARYFWDLVKEEGDPMENIARRYFFHIPCARMVGGFSQRVEFLKQLVNDFKADGIVFQEIKFCQPWEGEAHNIRWRLKKEGIPVLMLEREYHALAAGQVKTRVQAFMENLGK